MVKMKDDKIGLYGVLLTALIVFGGTTAAWVETQKDIVRLEEQVKMGRESNKAFNNTLHDLTSVLQQLSISMAGLDGRLGGMEKQLEGITKKI